MPCTPTRMPDGGTAILCTRGGRKRNLCCSCRAYATLECDWPTADGKTCSKPICRTCARAVGDNVDYCPFHRGDPPLTEEQGLAAGEAEADNAARILGVKR